MNEFSLIAVIVLMMASAVTLQQQGGSSTSGSKSITWNTNNYPLMPQKSNLIAFCPLDSTSGLYDVVSNHSITDRPYFNSSSAKLNPAPGPFGQPNTSYTVSDVYTGFNGQLAVSLSHSFTWSFYFKPSTPDGISGILRNSQINITKNSTSLQLQLSASGKTLFVAVSSWANWNFFAVTYDESQNPNLLAVSDCNGTQLATTNGAGISDSSFISLGWGGNSAFFKAGDGLACFAVYNTALSSTDIAALSKACPAAVITNNNTVTTSISSSTTVSTTTITTTATSSSTSSASSSSQRPSSTLPSASNSSSSTTVDDDYDDLDSSTSAANSTSSATSTTKAAATATTTTTTTTLQQQSSITTTTTTMNPQLVQSSVSSQLQVSTIKVDGVAIQGTSLSSSQTVYNQAAQVVQAQMTQVYQKAGLATGGVTVDQLTYDNSTKAFSATVSATVGSSTPMTKNSMQSTIAQTISTMASTNQLSDSFGDSAPTLTIQDFIITRQPAKSSDAQSRFIPSANKGMLEMLALTISMLLFRTNY